MSLMRTWTPDSHYSLGALPRGGEAMVIEGYSEHENGFRVGEQVEGVFRDGTAILEVTTNTQTFIARIVEENTLRSAGFDSVEALQAAIPDTRGENTISIVRFRIVSVLQPCDGQPA